MKKITECFKVYGAGIFLYCTKTYIYVCLKYTEILTRKFIEFNITFNFVLNVNKKNKKEYLLDTLCYIDDDKKRFQHMSNFLNMVLCKYTFKYMYGVNQICIVGILQIYVTKKNCYDYEHKKMIKKYRI